MAGFWAWAAAQVLKVFTKRWKKGYWDWGELAASGGMPSSHSALSVAVTAAGRLGMGEIGAIEIKPRPCCLALAIRFLKCLGAISSQSTFWPQDSP